MAEEFNLEELIAKAQLKDRYEAQIERLERENINPKCVKAAVDKTLEALAAGTRSLVIYGDPQSGKTEMMICLTARLLDDGNAVIVHLLNDNVDLLSQSLRRFRQSSLAPAPRISSEFDPQSEDPAPPELVVFCKKNAKDLERFNEWVTNKVTGKIVVIDDEADYATPNSKINQSEKSKINASIEALLGEDGIYVGVTATPARLDLNHTFGNDTSSWVNFPAHDFYTGQKAFFPLNGEVKYRRKWIGQASAAVEATNAFVRFLVTVAYLNTRDQSKEENYTMLVHTSGKTSDHEEDRKVIAKCVEDLLTTNSDEFKVLARKVFEAAKEIFPSESPKDLTTYVVRNASRATLVKLNSERDRKSAGDNPTEPTSPFTIVIGGNIISRGVTFPNLLSMFFTRDVQTRLQQDTYIQRARMFGARGEYLNHFELTIPEALYVNWHKCFVFHKLSLDTIKADGEPPVWIADKNVSVTSSASVAKADLNLMKSEMSFAKFKFDSKLDDVAALNPRSVDTLQELASLVGEKSFPGFLIDYVKNAIDDDTSLLAVHTSYAITGYDATVLDEIRRGKGLLGTNQLEKSKFPTATHHFRIIRNPVGEARVFYKFLGSIQFMQSSGADDA